jgi:hypothetical protein
LAMASTSGGVVRPAKVLRLMRNSNLVGCN